MSTELLEDANLKLLLASPTQALWHALAFCQARSVRALGAPRAHVLHTRTTEPPRLAPGLCSPTGPRPILVRSPEPSKSPLVPYSAAVRALLAARRRSQHAPAMAASPKPQLPASCPLEQLEVIHEPAR